MERDRRRRLGARIYVIDIVYYESDQHRHSKQKITCSCAEEAAVSAGRSGSPRGLRDGERKPELALAVGTLLLARRPGDVDRILADSGVSPRCDEAESLLKLKNNVAGKRAHSPAPETPPINSEDT